MCSTHWKRNGMTCCLFGMKGRLKKEKHNDSGSLYKGYVHGASDLAENRGLSSHSRFHGSGTEPVLYSGCDTPHVRLWVATSVMMRRAF